MIDFGSAKWVALANSFVNITTLATTAVKSGAGVLHAVVINAPAATGTITIYDNTAASGTVIATLTMVAGQPVSLPYNIVFNTGLTIVTAVAAGNITISYQ